MELVVTLLARGLRRQGHRVTLFGAEGSEPGITVCAPAGLDAHLGQATQVMYEMTYLARVVQRMRAMAPFDVIHDHAGFGGAMIASLLQGSPVLHTVHGAIGVAELDFYNSIPGDIGLVAISESQRRQAPDLGWIGVVHNAVDVHHLTVAHPDLDPRYLLCLARICEDKGQHVAIAVARRCELRLVLAGKVEETSQGREYFHRKVEPYIDGTKVIYMPSVTGAAKARLIAGATATLAPISWPEPFGLSIVEAMVSGTPAISLRKGAAEELIEDGMTGFVVDDEDDMVAAVGRAEEIDVNECAKVARERFSPEVMTDGYVRLYRHALDRPMEVTSDHGTRNLLVNGGGFDSARDRLPQMVAVGCAFERRLTTNCAG